MVKIPIHDEDSFTLEAFERVMGSQRYIVEETEPHGPVVFGVVPGRPHQGKDCPATSLEKGFKPHELRAHGL